MSNQVRVKSRNSWNRTTQPMLHLAKLPLLMILLSLSMSCDALLSGKRDVVEEKDYRIVEMMFGLSDSKSIIKLEKVYFERGGLGATGELIYKATMKSGNLDDLTVKSNAVKIEHGLGTKIFPFETSFSLYLGEETLNLKEAYVLTSPIQVHDVSTTVTETYLFIDTASSPALTLYIKTDPLYGYI